MLRGLPHKGLTGAAALLSVPPMVTPPAPQAGARGLHGVGLPPPTHIRSAGFAQLRDPAHFPSTLWELRVTWPPVLVVWRTLAPFRVEETRVPVGCHPVRSALPTSHALAC